MRKPIVLGSPLLVVLLGGSLAQAASTYYVSPEATATSGCTREAPCGLGAGVSQAVAGDTVVLMDGIYHEQLWVENSGTETAWITFQADECATPILEGVGDDGDDQPTGVGSNAAEYLRFIGLVSRGWNMGFANGWAEEGETSNGHIEYQYCIGDANGRTGFTFFRADSVRIQNCISAHNGSSTLHSWSSGMTLLGSTGTNSVEGCVSFENIDGESHTDGSGFIVDEGANNATFLNNIAFGNAGSCLRLTKSSGTTFINNTCYHNAQDPAATGPTNPSELYFTNASSTGTTTGVSFLNNILVNTGTGAGAEAVVGQPTAGWSNNVVKTGAVTLFTDPDGNNPDFTIAAGASELVGQGATGGAVPGNDIGFDPKCIVKGAPTQYGAYTNASWWQYSINYDYIKSIGGVAKCFNPKSRTGTPDIGAYASGAVTTSPATCTVIGTGGAVGTGGGAGDLGGTTGAGGGDLGMGGGFAGDTGAGGALSSMGGSDGLGGNPAAGGTLSSAGGSDGLGGALSLEGGSTGLGGGLGAGGSLGLGGATAATGGSTAASGGRTSTSTGGSAGLGTSSTGGAQGPGGALGAAGTVGTVGGNAAALGGAASAGDAGVATATDASSKEDSGCGCRVAGASSPSSWAVGLGLVGLMLRRLRRRRASR